ncbi:hypothetical protein [Bacillus sp. EB600]|uniref:hypothetical protein n=1 Tax=Bacillus sp. EB600 TaxID=2806345 RepID=UPI00210C2043|nr:hypothetical protein [Bacillus sp. EB600]MCQ6279249.1 hypothetical protein [Bacillus sp. EB600]
MEKIITDITIFESYKDRQVVLNYYEDQDVLFQRDGFHFYSIKVLRESDELLFTKIDGSCCTISIKNYSDKYVDNQFPNYYVLTNGSERLDIYIPS